MKNESAVVSKQGFKLPFPLSQSAGKTTQVGTTIIIIIIIIIIMSVLDKMNKKCYIIEGTVCVPGTIPARTVFKRDKNEDLRLGVTSWYPGHKVTRMQVVFDFLAANPIDWARELADILQDRRNRNG